MAGLPAVASAQGGTPPHLHGRQRRRREEHADRAPALRLARRLRGPGAIGPRLLEEPDRRARSISRCSPTACARSASRASPSTSPTAISRPRGGNSSSPTRRGTSSTRATWRPARRPRISRSCWSMRGTAFASRPAVTPASRGCSGSRPSCSPSTRSIWSASTRAFSARSAPTCRTCSATRASRRFRSARCTATTSSRRAIARPGMAVRRSCPTWRPPTRRRGMRAARFRFPVQLVLRPDADFRGYAGQIASGAVTVGDRVTAWPSGAATRVKRIVTWDGDLHVGGRADVRHARPRGRSRHQPRRHRWRSNPFGSGAASPPMSSGWTSVR